MIRKLKRHFSVHGTLHILISDNDRQDTSQQFRDFAKQWDFIHVTSSPKFLQSNGLAERAVHSAKQLMEKSHRDVTDVFFNLLNLRNIPRDPTLGSPAQRLLSRQTRSAIPVNSKLLEPVPKYAQQVTAHLLHKRMTQKRYYDASSRPLQPLTEGQVVRMQTPKGYNHLTLYSIVVHYPMQWENIQEEPTPHPSRGRAPSFTAYPQGHWLKIPRHIHSTVLPLHHKHTSHNQNPHLLSCQSTQYSPLLRSVVHLTEHVQVVFASLTQDMSSVRTVSSTNGKFSGTLVLIHAECVYYVFIISILTISFFCWCVFLKYTETILKFVSAMITLL